jgi:hypothetical protein
MLSEVGTLIGLFIILFIVRVIILVTVIHLNRKISPNDIEGVVILDLLLNAIIFVSPVAGVWYGILHPSTTVFYGFLIEIVICWLIGFIPMCMSTENHEVKEIPGVLPKFLRPR